tara:strand:+ start:1559 stop:1783 length:225 start_codon:yes stop_codon:yes gene_type:complete
MLLNDYEVAFFVLDNKKDNCCKNVNLKNFNFKYEQPIHDYVFSKKLYFSNNKINKSFKNKNKKTKTKKNKTEKT